MRYKEGQGVYWQYGVTQFPSHVMVNAPTPYRKSKSKRLYYRDPAYLLTSDLRSSLKQLLQIYFDRWQIGVSSQGHTVPSSTNRPRLTHSNPVAGEVAWRARHTARPTVNQFRKRRVQPRAVQPPRQPKFY